MSRSTTAPAPNAPTNPDITDDSFAPLIFITWTNPVPFLGATNEVWKSSDGINFVLFTTVGGGVSQASDVTGLGVGQFAYYKIRSCSGASCSTFSAVVSAVNDYTSPNQATISFPTLIQAFGSAFTANGLAALTSVSLPKLRRVVNNLIIANNANLTTVDLTALRTVGINLLMGSNKITGAMSFPALLSTGGDFQLFGNTLMTSLSAPLVTSVGGICVFSGDTALTTFNFNSLQTVGLIAGGRLDFNGCTALTSASFPVLADVNNEIVFNNCNILTAIQFPLLVAAEGIITGNACPLLATWNAPNWFIEDSGQTMTWANCGLNAASVNQILARGVASNPSTDNFQLAGGTNAAPSGQGVIDKAALIVAGNIVNTN